MKVITISAKAMHGKDTTANILKEKLENNNKKVLILHYADYLKFICSQYFGWDGEKDEKGRTILQYVGTEIVRKKDPNFWVSTIIRFMWLFKDQYDYFIIPDTRFPNEIEMLKEFDYDVIALHVERSDFESPLTIEQKNHPSETALDNFKFDYYIQTSSSILKLEKHVNKFLKYLGEDYE